MDVQDIASGHKGMSNILVLLREMSKANIGSFSPRLSSFSPPPPLPGSPPSTPYPLPPLPPRGLPRPSCPVKLIPSTRSPSFNLHILRLFPPTPGDLVFLLPQIPISSPSTPSSTLAP
eukprot:462443-Hanusia_phi.AAC.1